MTNFETRKIMWGILSRLFTDHDEFVFIWIFSPNDLDEANRMPDGISNFGYLGVARGVEP